MTRHEIVAQLRTLGVAEGGVLLVHSSYRAVRPVEGGPAGLIAALRAGIGPAGTLVMPSWTGDDDAPFDPAVTPANPDLGVVPDTFWRRPGVHRSNHPFAFAAAGPLAERITGDPLPLPPHRLESGIGRAWEADAQVLLLGINHDSDTMIHLGEIMAGVPYGVPKHITVFDNGAAKRIDYLENDHCCTRFTLVDGWLDERGLQRTGPVGNGTARLARARDIVTVVGEHLAGDPLLFLHGDDDGCADCLEARRSVR